jgi:hypothetical protein
MLGTGSSKTLLRLFWFAKTFPKLMRENREKVMWHFVYCRERDTFITLVP